MIATALLLFALGQVQALGRDADAGVNRPILVDSAGEIWVANPSSSSGGGGGDFIVDGGVGWETYAIVNLLDAGTICLGGVCNSTWPAPPPIADFIVDGGVGWETYAIVNLLDAGTICLGGVCNSTWPAPPPIADFIVDGGVGWETYAIINILDAGTICLGGVCNSAWPGASSGGCYFSGGVMYCPATDFDAGIHFQAPAATISWADNGSGIGNATISNELGYVFIEDAGLGLIPPLAVEWTDGVGLNADGSGNLNFSVPGLYMNVPSGTIFQWGDGILLGDAYVDSATFAISATGGVLFPAGQLLAWTDTVSLNTDGAGNLIVEAPGGVVDVDGSAVSADAGYFGLMEFGVGAGLLLTMAGTTYLNDNTLCLDNIPGCAVNISTDGITAVMLNDAGGNWLFHSTVIADAGVFGQVQSAGFPVPAVVAFDGGSITQTPLEVVGSVLSSASSTVTTNIGHTFSSWNECFCTVETTSVVTADVGCTETLSTVTVAQTTTSTARVKYRCIGL